MKSILLLLIVAFLYSKGLNQEYIWCVTLETGEIYENVVLGGVDENELKIYVKPIGEIDIEKGTKLSSKSVIKVPLKLLMEISEKRKSKVARFSALGFLIGAGIGIMISASGDKVESTASWGPDFTPIIKGGTIGGFTGLFVGGIFGQIVSKDKVYNLREYTVQEKKDFLIEKIKIQEDEVSDELR